jgi:signal transduction histidine kinase
MGEKRHSQVGGMQSSHWIDGGAVAQQPVAAISARVWLTLFVAAQAVMIASVLLWPNTLWLPFLCDAVMAALTFLFAADRLRVAKPVERLIWIILLSAMALLCMGHLLQCWDLVRTEIYVSPALQPANVSAMGRAWGALFVSARVPFLFLFAQMDENDDKSTFRVIDGLQALSIVCLITMAYSPNFLGAPPLSPRQSVILLSLVFPLLTFFGLMNWLGRVPDYGRQLIGAIILYLLAKSIATPLLQEARKVPVMALLFQTLPHLVFVTAALHQFRPTRPLLSAGLRQTIRFLNPVCFMVASVCLAFAIARYSQFLGGALMLLSVILYVLRSAKWQSDFRRLKIEAAAAALARSNFLLDINHEIRSPLTSITLNASRLNREAGLSADKAALVRKIYKGADLVISTLNNILDMSRMEAGAIRVPLKPFDAGPVISEVVELLELQAESRDIVIDWRAAPVPLLLGDAKRLRQVLTNILSNAIRHAPQHSKIVVEVNTVSWGDGVAGRITVTDFGEGIPQSQQELLFRRFSQLGENIAGSSGLGLAISKVLMDAMGGTIAYESEPGRTSFWVELRRAG